MTQSTSSPIAQADAPPHAKPASDNPEPGDSLSHLHRMSRTAGLGSGDYVEINILAVLGIILGLSSALVVVDPLFLVLPIAGIVLSIIAIAQIRSSNGTQTGLVMAIAGLLLSFGFFAYKAGGQTFQEIRTREDRATIDRMLGRFGQDLNRGNDQGLADAYGMFDSTFTGRVPLGKFTASFKSAINSPYFGPIKSVRSNGQVKFETDPRSGELLATSLAIVDLAKSEAGNAPHWVMLFRKEAGQWHFEDLPELFPNLQANPQNAGRAAAPGGR